MDLIQKSKKQIFKTFQRKQSRTHPLTQAEVTFLKQDTKYTKNRDRV